MVLKILVYVPGWFECGGSGGSGGFSKFSCLLLFVSGIGLPRPAFKL